MRTGYRSTARRWVLVLCLLGGLARPAGAQAFLRGVDVSHLPQLEDYGAVFRENGTPRDLLPLLREHGVNAVRLRLWHRPPGGYSNLARTLAMARRVEAEGMTFLLDLHYSDTWADPGRQTKPAAWSALSYDVLRDSVRAYTRDVIAAFKAQGTLPDIVQIGNEITSGMLWPTGRVGGSYDGQWPQLVALLQAGIDGVHDALAPGDSVEIMIHIDRGGDYDTSRWYYDNLRRLGLEYDIIGLSYYPWWHGSLTQMAQNLNNLANRYGKDIVIAETAYPFTLQWDDNTNNIVGLPQHLHAGYPASVEGQRRFVADLMARVAEVPNGHGRGIFYWEPDHIAVPGVGSPWENLALFDFDGDLLASVAAFAPSTVAAEPEAPTAAALAAYSYPNPFDRAAEIHYDLPAPGPVDVRVYDLLGREVAVLLDAAYQPAGRHSLRLDGEGLAAGLYLYRIRTAGGTTARLAVRRD